MSSRDCSHGHLARSCGLCERDASIAALRKQLDENDIRWLQNLETTQERDALQAELQRYKANTERLLYLFLLTENGDEDASAVYAETYTFLDLPARTAEFKDKFLGSIGEPPSGETSAQRLCEYVGCTLMVPHVHSVGGPASAQETSAP